VQPGDLVLDVGAGHGAITAALVAAGARVVAVELHPQRASVLRRRFAEEPRVVVVRADATDLRLPCQPFHVVANPPFAATAALVRRLLSRGSRLVQADLVVPLHVARRLAHREQSTGRAAAVHRLPASAFRPPPPNPVAVVRLVRSDSRREEVDRLRVRRPSRR
jgi:23S rRNA (adenine-N6)-dimethyltransferase